MVSVVLFGAIWEGRGYPVWGGMFRECYYRGADAIDPFFWVWPLACYIVGIFFYFLVPAALLLLIVWFLARLFFAWVKKSRIDKS